MMNKKIEMSWRERLNEEIESALVSYYEDLEINPYVDAYGVKYSPDRKRLLQIPDGLEKYVVKEGTEILLGILSNSISLKYIIIPSSVVAIWDDVFCGLEKLINVSLCAGLKLIGDRAFAGCGFSTLTIPDGVEVIGDECFCENDMLTSIDLPTSIKSIGIDVFDGCINLESIIIPIGTRKVFEQLLPQYKDILLERVS
jgi:hypothetical protein